MKHTTVCDKCGHEFIIKPKRIKEEIIDSNYRHKYLQCPNNKCKAKYTIAYSSNKTRELQEQWHREGGVSNTQTHKKLMEELRKVNEYMKFMNK